MRKRGGGNKKINVLQNLSCQTGRHQRNPHDLDVSISSTNDSFFINTSNICLLVENDNYKQSLYRMLRCIRNDLLSDHMHFGTRSTLQIYNILDMNIVPINFHALQRELPLINLYNYSYTFDQLIKESFADVLKGATNEDIKYPTSNTIKTLMVEDTLARILIHPLGERTKREYINNVWTLMAGGGVSLNTPKYLSDQLWNKVLLNSLAGHSSAKYDDINFQETNREYDAQHKQRGDLIINDSIADSNLRASLIDGVTYRKERGNTPNRHDINDVEYIQVRGESNWSNIGYNRYNTVIVRYIEWFVHVQRVMRLLMRSQLEWVNDPIVHKSNAISTDITEYDSNRRFDIKDFE